MTSICLSARGVTVDISDSVVEQLQRQQGLTKEAITEKFARAIDRIIDGGPQYKAEYYIEYTLR